MLLTLWLIVTQDHDPENTAYCRPSKTSYGARLQMGAEIKKHDFQGYLMECLLAGRIHLSWVSEFEELTLCNFKCTT